MQNGYQILQFASKLISHLALLKQNQRCFIISGEMTPNAIADCMRREGIHQDWHTSGGCKSLNLQVFIVALPSLLNISADFVESLAAAKNISFWNNCVENDKSLI
jgi:hypothetical protein